MASRTVLETLEAARKLLTPRRTWTQGVFAKNKRGYTVSSNSPDACCWCALGAINASTDMKPIRAKAAGAFEGVVGDGITAFNDRCRSKKMLLAAFDAAIAKEKEAQHA